jgi:twitching motility protein PilT
MIAGTLKGIVSQRLVPTADGKGRVACCEILVMTGRVHDMILDPKLTGQLPEVIAEGHYYGMQTFDQHLLKHLHAGRITMDSAMRVATSPHDFKLMVAASGKARVSNGASPAPLPEPGTGPATVEEIVASDPAPAPATLAEPPAYAPVTAPEPPSYEPPSMPAGYEPTPPAPSAAPAPSGPPAPPAGGSSSAAPPPSAPPPSY